MNACSNAVLKSCHIRSLPEVKFLFWKGHDGRTAKLNIFRKLMDDMYKVDNLCFTAELKFVLIAHLSRWQIWNYNLLCIWKGFHNEWLYQEQENSRQLKDTQAHLLVRANFDNSRYAIRPLISTFPLNLFCQFWLILVCTYGKGFIRGTQLTVGSNFTHYSDL